MAKDFQSARFWARDMIEEALREGGAAVDATMGNGHDTLWLCQAVGETGHVYAFDVQKEALERTDARLTEAGVRNRAELILSGHQYMARYISEQVDCVLFNLGWLPGVAHQITTRAETTLAAVSAALSLLKPAGLLTVCAYPGHDEGRRELDALLRWAEDLDPARFDAMRRHYMNQRNDPPQLIAVRRRP